MDIVERDPARHDAELLIQRYLDGIASESEIQCLSDLVEADSDVAHAYVRLAYLHASLLANEDLRDPGNRISNAPADERQTMLPAASEVASRSAAYAVVASAMCVLIAIVGLSFAPRSMTGPHSGPVIVATVVSATGVKGMREHTVLAGQSQQLSAGTVELITTRKARLVLEAPARFHFESAQRLCLVCGRLTAEIPPSAIGFTVLTPTGEVVDLGTEFGVDVRDTGLAEVHVFRGEVEASSPGGVSPQSVVDGRALLLAGEEHRELAFRSEAFIRSDEVAALHAGLAFGQQQRSESALADYARDPAIIALFDFEGEDIGPGQYRMVQGRWPGSHAPDFAEASDHIRVNIGRGQSWPQLTLAAWVRLDGAGAAFQSLLHTDGWSRDKPGQIHWMLRRKTVMRLGVYGNSFPPGLEEHPLAPDSVSPVLPEHQGWFHVATVYDVITKTVRFYLNGRFDNEVQQATAHPAVFGPAQIGNWDGGDRKLNGRIDELLILGRVLTDGEIRSLYESGNPYGDARSQNR